MTRKQLINAVKGYFTVKELVCPHVYNKFKEQSWQFLSTEILSTIYNIRTKILKQPMIVNNWALKGPYSQRGLRCNMCNLVKDKTSVYMSAHCLGKGIDFSVKGVTAENIRNQIKSNLDKLEYPIRLEEGTTWVHVDCYTQDDSVKLITFKE